MEDMKYNLVRDEVADLFTIGKLARDTETNVAAIQRMLTHLGQPKPFLRPKQVRWWFGTAVVNGIDMPEWLLMAKLELDDMDEGLERMLGCLPKALSAP